MYSFRNCYNECLIQVILNNLKSITFCSISTGEFGCPKNDAAKIACLTVKDWIEDTEKLDFIVFNVFTQDDYKIYKNISKYYI